VSELQPLVLRDFTGGLNLRASDFQLAENESPDLLNVDIDPRGGVSTRKGWRRYNSVDVITLDGWDPRHVYSHQIGYGNWVTYVTTQKPGFYTAVYTSGPFTSYTGLFTQLLYAGVTPVTGVASPHLCSFASWGDACYIATGGTGSSFRHDGGFGFAVQLTDPESTWPGVVYNDDYTTPAGGYFPDANHIATHAGYMFAAGVQTGAGVDDKNLIRWSHPNEPEDWATNDFLVIAAGGSEITSINSFQDHLVIFKTDSIWALYGYDIDSWQLIQISRHTGIPSPTCVTRSEDALYFYSDSGRGGVYRYDGNSLQLISEKLIPVFEDVTRTEDIWVSWVGRRLWLSVPWSEANLGEETGSSTFVWDPTVNGGAWTRYAPAVGSFRQAVEGSDVEGNHPLGTLAADSGEAIFVELDAVDEAEDYLTAILSSPTAFEARYRTRWQDAGRPDLAKKWHRPTLVYRATEDVDLDVDVYWNYDEDTSRISFAPTLAAADERVRLTRGFGPSDSMQINISTQSPPTGEAWDIESIQLKYRQRRYTT
jgi:hypothetical protein